MGFLSSFIAEIGNAKKLEVIGLAKFAISSKDLQRIFRNCKCN